MFTAMKPEIEAMIEKYGTDSPPPPAQLFTVPNHPGSGNIHFVQQVFQGAFEFDILFESGSASEPVSCKFGLPFSNASFIAIVLFLTSL